MLHLARYTYILALIIGGFSLARINTQLAVLGIFGEGRYGLLFLALALIALHAFANNKLPSTNSFTWFWTGLVILLHAYAVFSIVWSVNISRGLEKLGDILLVPFLMIIAIPIFAKSLKSNTELLLGVFFIFSSLFLVANIAVNGLFSDDMSGNISNLGAGGIGTARLYGTAVLAAIYFWMTSKKLYWLIPVPILLLSILLSGSRSSLLALLLAMPLAIVPLLSVLTAKTKFWGSIGIGTAFYGFFTLPFARQSLILFWQSNWSRRGLYLADRNLIFSDAWDIFSQNPTQGIGLGSYFGKAAGELYPHNLVLNIAVDVGIFGLVLFGLIFFCLIVRYFHPKNIFQHIALAVGLFYFFSSLFTGTYYDARFMWLFFLLYMMPDRSRPNLINKTVANDKITFKKPSLITPSE